MDEITWRKSALCPHPLVVASGSVVGVSMPRVGGGSSSNYSTHTWRCLGALAQCDVTSQLELTPVCRWGFWGIEGDMGTMWLGVPGVWGWDGLVVVAHGSLARVRWGEGCMVRREAARRDGGGAGRGDPGSGKRRLESLESSGRLETRTEPCGKWMWAHVWCQHRQTLGTRWWHFDFYLSTLYYKRLEKSFSSLIPKMLNVNPKCHYWYRSISSDSCLDETFLRLWRSRFLRVNSTLAVLARLHNTSLTVDKKVRSPWICQYPCVEMWVVYGEVWGGDPATDRMVDWTPAQKPRFTWSLHTLKFRLAAKP